MPATGGCTCAGQRYQGRATRSAASPKPDLATVKACRLSCRQWRFMLYFAGHRTPGGYPGLPALNRSDAHGDDPRRPAVQFFPRGDVRDATARREGCVQGPVRREARPQPPARQTSVGRQACFVADCRQGQGRERGLVPGQDACAHRDSHGRRRISYAAVAIPSDSISFRLLPCWATTRFLRGSRE